MGNPLGIKTGVDGCIRCSFINNFAYSTGRGAIHKHHVDPTEKNTKGKSVSDIIKLCTIHHSALHQYYIREAYKIAIEQNPNFFEDIMEKYLNERNTTI